MRRSALQVARCLLSHGEAGLSQSVTPGLASCSSSTASSSLAHFSLPHQSNSNSTLNTSFPPSPISTRGFAANSHDLFNQHKDTADNNADTVFEWTEVGGW